MSQEVTENINEETDDEVVIEKGTTIDTSFRCNRSTVNAIKMYPTNGNLISVTIKFYCALLMISI